MGKVKNSAYKKNERNRICVYEHYYDCEEKPFYVGQGRISRAFTLSRSARNKSWNNKVNDTSLVKVKIIKIDISYEESIEIEKELIKKYGRLDLNTGCLTNENDGGANSQCDKDNYFYDKHFFNEENHNFGNKYDKNPLSKPVVQIDILGNVIKHWSSATEAMDCTGIDSSSIGAVCLGKRYIAGGYKWIFKEFFNPNDDNSYTPGPNNSRIYIGVPKDESKPIYVFYGTGESKKYGFTPDKVGAVARGARNIHKGYVFYDFFKISKEERSKYMKYIDITKI